MGRSLGMGAGLVVPPEPKPEIPEDADLLEVIALELRRIRKRVAPPVYEQEIPINLADEQQGEHNCNGNETNAMTVTVFSGTLEVWARNGAGDTLTPPYQFTALGFPVQILLPLRERTFSWRAEGATVAMLILKAI